MSPTAKPKTYCRDLEHLSIALQPYTSEKRWNVWRWEWRENRKGGGKWTKPPYQPHHPTLKAESNNPSTWGTYTDAVAVVNAGGADGIGLMLKGAGLGAIDLDHCVDRTTASGFVTWADQLHSEAAGAYQEVTVSGGGLRIIGKATGPEVQRKFTFDRKTGAGIELYRDTARYITVSGLELGHCPELPPFDAFIDTLLARHSAPADAPTGALIGHGAPTDGIDFNAAPQQDAVDYNDLIQNGVPEGERSEAFQSCVWHLAGQGWTFEEILEELARYPKGIGAKYGKRRLHTEVARSYDKWRSHKRSTATGSVAAAPGSVWPQILVKAGELPRVVNEAETALLGLGREIYQRGGLIVRPVQLQKIKAADDRDTQGWQLIPVTRPDLVETLTCAARFLKYDARVKGFVPTDAPDKIADAYLMRHGKWKLPTLAGIVNTPFIRGDGSVCEQPGYDPASGLLFKPDGQTFPSVPLTPSKADALEALAILERVIETFPFVTTADRSVALSAILTALDRHAMPTAPLHAFTSPTAGTGKSLLVDVVAMIATGQLMPVIAQGRTEEELEKRLGAALLAGDAVISLDNCEHPLQSTFLCQALTQRHLNIRMLGLSKNIKTPITALIFATGNNLSIVGDLVRRTLLCSLNAYCERPELRTFEANVIETVRANRGSLVVAGLTILRTWQSQQGGAVKAVPLGSFEKWSQRIRDALLWLGRADPCETMIVVHSKDPKREALLTVVMQWKANLGLDQAYTIQDIIERAINISDFHSALVAVAGTRSGGSVSNERLGRWLRQMEGKIVNGHMMLQDGSRDGYPLWKLV
jgi:hypothetical protein